MFFIQKNIVMHGTSMVLTFELKTRACRCVKAHSSFSGGLVVVTMVGDMDCHLAWDSGVNDRNEFGFPAT